MRRLGIFVLYDADGVADDYVKVLLSSLKNEIQEIFIVINGSIGSQCLEGLHAYGDEIFCRDNIGFDAGAYKDTFLYFLPRDKRGEYDEIVLMNDTFFGPVFPLKPFFDRVETETADFWGTTRHPEKKTGDGRIIKSHVQAYFLAIRRSLFMSDLFEDFWRELAYPRSYREAVWNFEIKFTVYFEERGFWGITWMDLHEGFSREAQEENPYLLHCHELIKDLRVPFLKKKCLAFENRGYINALEALEFIEEKSEYDTGLIWGNIFRLCRQNLFPSILDYDGLEHFYTMHGRIYIYGAGIYGQRMAGYFRYRKWTFECFLVSGTEDERYNCRKYGGMGFGADDGIILALGKAAFDEVYPVVMEALKPGQLFLLRYD